MFPDKRLNNRCTKYALHLKSRSDITVGCGATHCNRHLGFGFQVDQVLTLISPLVQDQVDQPDEEEDPEDFLEEQVLVGRFANLMVADSADQQYLVSVLGCTCIPKPKVFLD